MTQDEIECWTEAVGAREEDDLQKQMNLHSMTTRHDKPGVDARNSEHRRSRYAWHDHLRQEVDLRKK